MLLRRPCWSHTPRQTVLMASPATINRENQPSQDSRLTPTVNAAKKMGKNREEKLRSYQTLGICAGAALTIILM